MSFTVAIIGRPNVGKSTLFNRLTGTKHAIVDDRPGVTRDRREGAARIGPLRFRVIDTAGLEEAEADSLTDRMRRQTEAALDESDVCLFLIDARSGLTPMDRQFADWLRSRDEPVVLGVNKSEGRAGEAGVWEAFELGLGDPVAISAAHGEGMGDLHDALAVFEPAPTEADESGDEGDKPLQLAIVGRPNAGKSTLVNRLIGDDRMLTGPEAGITRDAIAIDWQWRDRPIRLHDTAGMRRQARIDDKLESLAVRDALRVIRYAEVVVVLIDALAPLEKQDLTIARHALEEGRAVVVAVNKWDLVTDRSARLRDIRERLETGMGEARGVALVTLSALTGRSVDRLMPAVLAAHECWSRRIATGELNRWLELAQERHPPPLGHTGRRIRLRYATQAKARPPTFAIFCNMPQDLPDSYLRYLQNGLRETFDLSGTPIRINLRKPRNPYAR